MRLGDKQNIVACHLTKEEKWVVTCVLTKDTGEFGCFGETLCLCFDLWSSAWGIQTLQTEISGTKHPSDFRQVCLLQHGCIIECLSWKVQTFSALPAKRFCRRLDTTFLASVCYDCERKSDVWMNLSGRQTQWCMTLSLICLLSEMLAKELHI